LIGSDLNFLQASENARAQPTTYHLTSFSWEKKLVAPLIGAPNGEMRKWEDKGQSKNA
jgi:hypothetical protein